MRSQSVERLPSPIFNLELDFEHLSTLALAPSTSLLVTQRALPVCTFAYSNLVKMSGIFSGIYKSVKTPALHVPLVPD